MNDKEMMMPYINMGGSFLLGLSIGFAIKKSLKIILFIFGFGAVFIFLLEHQGIVTLNEDILNSQIGYLAEQFKMMIAFLKDRLGEYKTAGTMSAVAGFLVGLKIG
ncbi:MAG: FUN14 domain-containing protein [Sulfurovum sp.]